MLLTSGSSEKSQVTKSNTKMSMTFIKRNMDDTTLETYFSVLKYPI